MEEEIQKIRKFENIDMAIKIYKEFRRFKNDEFIESIDPDFFFNLTDYILANSIPISLIEKEIEEYEEIGMIGVADCMKRLLNERSNTDV